MPRQQRQLLNLVVFASVLIIILYLNLGTSGNDNNLAWTTIRYQSTSSTLPKNHGICPGLKKAKKPVLVVSHVAADGELKWTDALSDRYHLCIYQVDAKAPSTELHVPANRGHEAMAYLTFIIDNYNDIPASGAVFVHGSRFSWHNDSPDYDNLKLLQSLNISSALSISGFHNLRCDWSAGTCDAREAQAQGSIETKLTAKLEPYNERANSDAAIPRAFADIFGGEASTFLGRGQAVRSQCCAQFLVSRDSVLRHSRDEYVALRQWLLDDGAAPANDKIAGRILSYLWHILFINYPGMDYHEGIDIHRVNAFACPTAADCYCRLYGRCELEGCHAPGQCIGQYTVPRDYKLPNGWAATHG